MLYVPRWFVGCRLLTGSMSSSGTSVEFLQEAASCDRLYVKLYTPASFQMIGARCIDFMCLISRIDDHRKQLPVETQHSFRDELILPVNSLHPTNPQGTYSIFLGSYSPIWYTKLGFGRPHQAHKINTAKADHLETFRGVEFHVQTNTKQLPVETQHSFRKSSYFQLTACTRQTRKARTASFKDRISPRRYTHTV
ncbi:hypothetical protein CDAR_583771 [Caerostris darwini]|uniref:Uncharacterized protein n=1 Tax=Caerostris darwini TaxID=1538125 RepID=A0AAV4RE45_9ARAC|nr:hypothetical protein CDAR_583771 [Caerostris darwini]